MRILSPAIAVPFMLALALPASADPLSDLLARGKGGACYERVYDKAHLAQHPKQATQAVLLSLREFSDGNNAIIRIRVSGKGGTHYIVGGCDWQEHANLDIQDKPLIEAFRGPSGLDCHAMTSADGSSAEEGGDFPIDLRDGKAILLYFPDSLAAWHSYDRRQPAEFRDFSTEDRVFRLDKVKAGLCSEMDKKLPGWD
ncbi:hypothetical protein G6N74_19095 [Mesorhizobium sp. CGMCC 1.15528]|uniref:Uncharacterized protein n=1 Tax=Mesorhizobium zhangyense TaxID=1776730 RepID=A0A7C9R921_9HYPH|nr:hypothetical protein [Mesorhizobium zhangyense]NGN43181.1 hypothetical protein [Mesorhizobium zhangyense]